ncbi:MAG: P-II family nitrogen regulator [Pseudomonadaceae bacterium]|nr:MAG: P-II family nitrogen regulator [Pseudomonadaceae bacterium]
MDFRLIIAFVDYEKTGDVMDAARAAGSTGATIIGNARGQGLQKITGIFGLEVLSPREVIMILVEARRSEQVMDAIVAAANLDESLSTGIALELDVNKAIGLSEHIKALQAHIPSNSPES